MRPEKPNRREIKTVIALPAPRLDGEVSLERALARRRSVRDYKKTPLSFEEVSQLLWAAQGITGGKGERTAPSAGALYPLELYLVAGNVTSLDAGVYQYHPRDHSLVKRTSGDLRATLAGAALKQDCVRDGAAVVIFSAVYARTTREYGERGVRYVHIDLGHAAQNVCLEAAALGLGAVPVGAFDDAAVRDALDLPSSEQVLYLIPVGKPA